MLSVVGFIAISLCDVEALEEPYSKAELNCFIEALEGDQRLYWNFPKFTVDVPIADCKTFIVKAQREGLATALKEIRGPSSTPMVNSLAIKIANRHNMIKDYWVSLIYRRITEDNLESLSNIFSDKLYGNFFDKIFTPIQPNPNDTSQELATKEMRKFCVKKLVIAKNLTESSSKLNLNLENKDFEGVDCYELVKPLIEDFRSKILDSFWLYLKLDDDQTKCAAKKLREERYLMKMLGFTFLVELELSQEQIVRERNNFIILMTQIDDSVTACEES